MPSPKERHINQKTFIGQQYKSMGLLPVPHQDFYLIDIKMGCTFVVHPILLYNRNCI
ncbi:hypothetical protein GCWU000325_01113 [Alloprevotella tannerae ATCC 51259]|uniref:Uncharacterized protein n=1 Tax=Alloprevotella tannerae ATCC 51259 TaxID=626522 RepID=C9LFX5_9BACT|nr:hypothetical protein GCWU000325_01113 [Alloprevotella tannerae ATCC 51259]